MCCNPGVVVFFTLLALAALWLVYFIARECWGAARDRILVAATKITGRAIDQYDNSRRTDRNYTNDTISALWANLGRASERIDALEAAAKNNKKGK